MLFEPFGRVDCVGYHTQDNTPGGSMAYTFDLERDFSPPEKNGADYVINFALGYELDTSEIVTMSVMLVAGDSFVREALDKPAGVENAIYDLQVGIRVGSAHNGGVSEPLFTTEASKKYIPDYARAQVALVVRNAIIRIIRDVRPHFLTMRTFYPNLTEKPLRKYRAISADIEGCGYKLEDEFRDGTDGNDYGTDGIHYWLYRRG